MWHPEEMVLRINGKRMSMWRASAREFDVLDVLVQKRRNKMWRKLLQNRGLVPGEIITDGVAETESAKLASDCIRMPPR